MWSPFKEYDIKLHELILQISSNPEYICICELREVVQCIKQNPNDINYSILSNNGRSIVQIRGWSSKMYPGNQVNQMILYKSRELTESLSEMLVT